MQPPPSAAAAEHVNCPSPKGCLGWPLWFYLSSTYVCGLLSLCQEPLRQHAWKVVTIKSQGIRLVHYYQRGRTKSLQWRASSVGSHSLSLGWNQVVRETHSRKSWQDYLQSGIHSRKAWLHYLQSGGLVDAWRAWKLWCWGPDQREQSPGAISDQRSKVEKRKCIIKCFQNSNSYLWNAMIAPLRRLNLFGFLWYQVQLLETSITSIGQTSHFLWYQVKPFQLLENQIMMVGAVKTNSLLPPATQYDFDWGNLNGSNKSRFFHKTSPWHLPFQGEANSNFERDLYNCTFPTLIGEQIVFHIRLTFQRCRHLEGAVFSAGSTFWVFANILQ